jgi:hypothetical protein
MTLFLRHLNRKEWKFATNESNHTHRPNHRLCIPRMGLRASRNTPRRIYTQLLTKLNMWILPKQLHTLDSVQDTEALNLDLNESSQLCAQSLFVRSKHSPLRTWLQKWKRDSWSQHLYGRILKPSLGKAFETEWTSLLEATPVNHSPQQESEQERKTQDTCGLGSQTEFGFCDQECASLRMSKDTSRWDSPASSATWKSWVTRCRGEYSLRVKLAHLTNGSGYSSWPTAAVMDTMGGPYKTEFVDGVFRSYHNHSKENAPQYGARLRDAVTCGLPAPANPSTDGSRQGLSEQSQRNWQTFAHGTHNRGETPHRQVVKALVNGEKAQTQCLTVDQVFAEEIKGTNPKSWATPRANKVHPEITEDNRDQLANRNKSNLEEEIAGHCGKATGKLNPRWVETLMGLPIGWTMPSCTRPVTIAPMNCDCLETESSQPPQNEHLELF